MPNLNEGFDLSLDPQDDPELNKKTAEFIKDHFDDAEVGELPDLKDGINVINALESAMMDLSYLSDSILSSGGMTQSFALEAERIMPGFLSEDRPLGFFTKTPTATQYTVSLEEINWKIASIAAAAFTAVVTLIYKVIKWLRGDKDDATGKPGRSGDKIVEKEEARVETAKQLEETLSEVDKKASHEHTSEEIIKKLAQEDPDSCAGRLTRDVPGYVYDYLSDAGEPMKFIRQLYTPTFRSMILGLDAEVERFYHLCDKMNFLVLNKFREMERQRFDKMNGDAFKSEDMEEVIENVRAIYLKPKKYRINGMEMTLSDLNDYFRKLIDEAFADTKTYRIANFKEALRMYGDNKRFEALKTRELEIRNLYEIIDNKTVKKLDHVIGMLTDDKGGEEYFTVDPATTKMSSDTQGKDKAVGFYSNSPYQDFFKEARIVAGLFYKELTSTAQLIYNCDRYLMRGSYEADKLFEGVIKEISKKLREEKEDPKLSPEKKEELEVLIKAYKAIRSGKAPRFDEPSSKEKQDSNLKALFTSLFGGDSKGDD